MDAVSGPVGELAVAQAAVAGRLRGIDPADFPALRQAYDAFAAKDPTPPIATESEIQLNGVKCLGMLPQGGSGDHVIFWCHGGGFTMGSSRSHRGLVAQVAGHAKTGAIIPDYRLAPEHRHPAAVDDCVAAYLGVLGESMKASNVIVAGDSAGGALAMAMLLRLKQQGAAMPAGLILLSPWVDLSNKGWSHAANAKRDPFLTTNGLATRAQEYFGGAGQMPILEADMSGLPPTYIQTGQAEILMSDSTALTERLGAAGVPVTLEIWPDMFHVFQARYATLSAGKQAVRRLGRWAAGHLGINLKAATPAAD
ncbi:MAG: alpha/beta hydrolase [Hyphomonadaceae bacterium]